MPIERLDQLHEVYQRPRDAIQLVTHDDIHTACLDVGQQPLQGGTLEGGAGESAIVVAVRHQKPTLGTLACDEGLASITLGIQRVEGLVQPFLTALARVNSAAEFADRYRQIRTRRGSA